MIKRRNISVHDDLKTGFLYKFCLILALILLVAYIILKFVPLDALNELSQSGIPEIALSFSIILFGVGFILYFFNCMFCKLAKIADEIEKEENFEEE